MFYISKPKKKKENPYSFRLTVLILFQNIFEQKKKREFVKEKKKKKKIKEEKNLLINFFFLLLFKCTQFFFCFFLSDKFCFFFFIESETKQKKLKQKSLCHLCQYKAKKQKIVFSQHF